jgi:adenine-specific DNA-methyltransferase
MEFSECSITLTKKLAKTTKKAEGIYFTPNKLVKYIYDFVSVYNKTKVLEPSCGSGEFLEYFNATAIEKNRDIYNMVKEKYKIICADFLEYKFEERFDLIVGNPPYFVIPKQEIDKSYYKYFNGRPNIYIIFIIKSFELLIEGGILAFVLPTNFLNCIYYNPLRKYLADYNILDISVRNERFLETSQEVCIFIIQKSAKINDNFVLNKFNITLFKTQEDIVKIKKLMVNTTTLSQLGCQLNIGTVVWNECKKELTSDTSKTLLVYSGDIKNNKLSIQKYKDPSKKNYINRKGSTDKVILINRGYGAGKYTFNYCLIDPDELNGEYLVENHCIVCHSKDPELIIKSFNDKRTQQFIELVFSNNAINIQELKNVLPIFMDEQLDVCLI